MCADFLCILECFINEMASEKFSFVKRLKTTDDLNSHFIKKAVWIIVENS